MKPPIRIVILDDHELVRKGLRALLDQESDLRVVGEADTCANALAITRRLHPQLVLLDMKLPDISGLDACRQLLSEMPQLRVLVLTSYAEEATVAAAIRGGAHGYLLKDVKPDELTHAIRIVAGGRGYLDSRITQQTFRWIQTSASSDGRVHRPIQLSSQERLIMPLLAQGRTNKEIATQLGLSDKTIKNYLANIYDKLGVSRRTEAVAWYIKGQPLSSLVETS
ncbi:MAG TPA: response regulator transcription factor [Nitrospira sp.]|nr:response regulator transcription factor [Nitrospira sp.]